MKQCKGKCVICESTIRPNAHHIIPRMFKELRWDVNNGVILCPKHHKFGRLSAHKNSLWFITLLRLNVPNKHDYLLRMLYEIEG